LEAENAEFQKAIPNMFENPGKSKIRLITADDHPIVRAGIRAFLTNDSRIEIVAEASDGREALAMVREHLPDVVFMDIYMPRMNGLVAAKLLSRQMPELKVLMHTLHDDQAHVLQIIRSGARGYVLKNEPMEKLADAIEIVHRGGTHYRTDIAQIALEEHSRHLQRRGKQTVSSLSERETEVLSKIAEGKTNREIAAELGISVRTVETHRERMMHKLQIHNVPGLIKFAIMQGVAVIEYPNKQSTFPATAVSAACPT
jgi:two-component system nitrate/nitrite response regulator NarL